VTHHGATAPIGTELLVVALLAAAWAYVAATRRTPWPSGRTARWLLGVAAAVAGLLVGLAGAHDLRLHVAGHLLVGMVAPLLLVTAAPVTLALRALPPRRARAVARLLRSRPAVVLTHPAVAAVLDVGGLWLMYRTGLLAAVPPALVQLHMLAAGYLFAFSLVGPDPAPHRARLGVRVGVLVAAVAAHDVLSKLVYAGGSAQTEAGGLLMYYGAAPVHLALFVLLGREWAAGEQRIRRRGQTLAATRSAASQVLNSSQTPGAPARISAGEGFPSTPPSTTPASRARSRPAATSHSLVPTSTPQSNRPQAR
jgi:putative membrane protein